MIRTFDVRLNAAHPELPLLEATAIVGSPSTANIYNVPKQIGTWDILKVYIEVSYPNGSTVVEEAVKTAQGIWTATVPMCETSGRVKSGFTVIADGEDENGDEVTGYILGVADFAVYTRGLEVRDGETTYNLRYFDTMPATPAKGDVTPIDGVPKLYDGYNWISFADEVDLSDYYTKAETDAAIEAVAAYYITYTAAGAAFPTRAALINAETYYSGGVARVPTRNDYAVVLADETHSGAEYRYIYGVAEGATTGQWEAQYPIETNDYTALSNKPTINNVELSGNKTGADVGVVDVAGATMTGALSVPHVDLTENVVGEPIIRTRIANGAILISWNSGTTYYKFSLPYINADRNMITKEDVESIFGKIAPTWNEAATYAVDDIVYWAGAYYRCIRAGTTGNPAYDISYWTREDLIASIQRAIGATVQQLAPTYSTATVSYRVNQLCSYGGQFFRCLVAYTTTASSPTPPNDTTHWEAVNAATAFFPTKEEKDTASQDTHGFWVYDEDGLLRLIKMPRTAGGGIICLLEDIGRDFSEMGTYEVDDVVVYQNKLWICINRHVESAFTPADFRQLKVGQIINLKANKSELRYDITTTEVTTASTDESDPLNPIAYAQVDVADRACTKIAVSTALDELRLRFSSGSAEKVVDFYARVEVGTGSAAMTAPAIVPVARSGTITIETADGSMPTLADGTAENKGITILYFTSMGYNRYMLKAATITEVA